MSASRAIEKIMGIEVSEEIEILRKIAYFGEWIQSHVLHFMFLHVPDFLGRHSIFDIVAENPRIVKDAIEVRKWGNMIIRNNWRKGSSPNRLPGRRLLQNN